MKPVEREDNTTPLEHGKEWGLKSSFDPKAIEERVRSSWETIGIPSKTDELRTFSRTIGYVEGPPTLNGEPHIGHIRGRVIKDLWYRFNTLKGVRVVFRAGWDTQGLPVELQAEKELGLKGNKMENLQAIGAEALVQACKSLVAKYGAKWREADRLLGMSFDYERAYWTYKDAYIEREWRYLQKAWEEGLLGEGYRVVAYCPGCQTSLSHAEVAQGYEQLEDPSLYFKVKLRDEDAYLVLWTTMPFTVVTDELVGVKPDSEYVYVRVAGEIWIVGKERLAALMTELGISDYDVLKTVRGKDLEGKRYAHPLLKFVPGLEALSGDPRVHSVVAEAFVDVTTGSGLVHIAPANGEVDFGVAKNRGLPVFNPIDDRLCFSKEAGVFGGIFVRDTDDKVVELLRKEGWVLKAARIVHDYPTCWRSRHRLVWVARREYFYWVERLGDRAVEAAKKVEYYYEAPANRFLSIIQEKVPWCISRERFWGTPLPIWTCSQCRHHNAVFSRKEIVDKALELPDGPGFELHRPWMDRVVLKCEKCGGRAQREPYVLDTWHNSGASPFASFTDEEYRSLVPVEFLTEGIDQTRGWAYTLLIENAVMSGGPQAPYKAFLFQGHVLDENGNKMSKSLGNFVEGLEVLGKESVDLLRFYLMWKAAPIDSLNYSALEIKGRPYQVLSTLYHLHVYFQQNSRYDGFAEATHTLEWAADGGLLKPQERWLLSKLSNLVGGVTSALENCKYHEACRACEAFVIDDLSQIYVPYTRTEIWDDSPETLRRRLAIYAILCHTLKTLDILLHPLSPYVTEYLYQSTITACKQSVLLEEWPQPNPGHLDPELEKDFEAMQSVVSLSNAARMKAKVKRRWPLQRACIYVGAGNASRLARHVVLLREQMNVKAVSLASSLKETPVKIVLVPRFELLGPRLKKQMSKVSALLSKADAMALYEELVAKGSLAVNLDGERVELGSDEIEVRFEAVEGWAIADRDGGFVAILVGRDRELIAEGLVRDIARRLQALRRERGFNPTEILDMACAADVEQEWLELLNSRLSELAFLVRVKEVRLVASSGTSAADSSLASGWSEVEMDGKKVKLYVGKKTN